MSGPPGTGRGRGRPPGPGRGTVPLTLVPGAPAGGQPGWGADARRFGAPGTGAGGGRGVVQKVCVRPQATALQPCQRTRVHPLRLGAAAGSCTMA